MTLILQLRGLGQAQVLHQERRRRLSRSRSRHRRPRRSRPARSRRSYRQESWQKLKIRVCSEVSTQLEVLILPIVVDRVETRYGPNRHALLRDSHLMYDFISSILMLE